MCRKNSSRCFNRRIVCVVLFLIIGLCLLCFGVTLWFVIPIIVRQKINAFLPLPNKTIIYDEWKNTSLPIYIQFWFFNVLNKDEVENGSKPDVEQVGPYTYREYRVKENITFYNNGSASYRQRRTFFFDRSRSVGDENDTVTTVNIPLVVIGEKIKNSNAAKTVVELIAKLLGDGDVLMKTNVKNITWGYEDPILKMVSSILKLFGIKIESTIGLFYGKNDTDDGEYLVDSGSLSLDSFLKVRKWKNHDKLTFWNDADANMINGTDGTMFPPFLSELSRNTPLYVFQSDICRSIYATHTSSPSIHGIPSRTFTPPYSVFANHSENPANFGFCVDGVCLGSGVLNLSSCVPGIPVVMSQPHLYQAAAKYQEDIVGLRPSPDCVTSLSMEPTTGIPLDLQKKLQINIAVEPIADFTHMGRLRKMLLPVMWLNESVAVDDRIAGIISRMLLEPVRLATYGSIALMAVAVAVVAVVAVVVVVRVLRREKVLKDIVVNDYGTIA